MTFDFLTALSESKLIPHRKTLHDYDAEELAELAFLNILTLRILLAEHGNGTALFAQKYCRKTAQFGNFKKWHTDSTDIYVMLYGLISDEAKNDRQDRHVHLHMPIEPLLLYRWFRSNADKRHDTALTHRVFVKLDTWFKIKNSSMKAIRRLVMDWDTITTKERKLALTRLLQFMRTRAARGELLPWLNRVGVLHDLEIDNVDNPETGERREGGHDVRETTLWRSLALESASAGATGAASVAAVVGGLGAGFDDDYSKSVYPPPKKSKTTVIKRVAEDDEDNITSL